MKPRKISGLQWSSSGHLPTEVGHQHTTSLQLFHRPGRVALLDDHPLFVEMLAEVLERSYRVQEHRSAKHCLESLQQEAQDSKTDFLAQRLVLQTWRAGAPLVPTVARYWSLSRSANRALTKVLIVDAMLPEMNGIAFLSRLTDWPGQRLLLCTNPFDEAAVAHAMDHGWVDQYVVKDSRSFPATVQRAVGEMYSEHDLRYTELWAQTLTAEQQRLLVDKRVARTLASILKNEFEEWLIVGRPFGVIGIKHNGRAGWLQLATRESLTALAESAITNGITRDDASLISCGKRLHDLDMRREFGEREIHLLEASVLDERNGLVVASSPIELPGADRDSDYKGP